MTPAVRQVIVARLAVARVTSGKTRAILNRVCRDGRLRGILAYWGAHTGRWAGRGFQPHNLTRPIKGVNYVAVHAHLQSLLGPGEVEDTLQLATAFLQSVCTTHGCDMGGLLSSLLRGVIVPGAGYLATADYSSIEARVILWLAGDEEGLAVYRHFDAHGGPDPYMHAASDIYGVPAESIDSSQRAVGKVCVLALGYAGSVGAFETMAPSYGVDVSGLDLETIVNTWRDGRPKLAGVRRGGFSNDEGRWIVTRSGGLWKEIERTVRLAISAPGSVFTAGRCTWQMDGPHLVCTLPSGRPLVYRDARIEQVMNQWNKVTPTITFFGKKPNTNNWCRVDTFGGRLSENITQAIARDLMADALVKLEPMPGLDVELTVHDEIIGSVVNASGLTSIVDAMMDTPAWAQGLPVAVAGGLMERYGKA